MSRNSASFITPFQTRNLSNTRRSTPIIPCRTFLSLNYHIHRPHPHHNPARIITIPHTPSSVKQGLTLARLGTADHPRPSFRHLQQQALACIPPNLAKRFSILSKTVMRHTNGAAIGGTCSSAFRNSEQIVRRIWPFALNAFRDTAFPPRKVFSTEEAREGTAGYASWTRRITHQVSHSDADVKVVS